LRDQARGSCPSSQPPPSAIVKTRPSMTPTLSGACHAGILRGRSGSSRSRHAPTGARRSRARTTARLPADRELAPCGRARSRGNALRVDLVVHECARERDCPPGSGASPSGSRDAVFVFGTSATRLARGSSAGIEVLAEREEGLDRHVGRPGEGRAPWTRAAMLECCSSSVLGRPRCSLVRDRDALERGAELLALLLQREQGASRARASPRASARGSF
jgi:hypothetical protein